MNSNYGIISNIQHFSVDDGPGIRTTVFFKGCNLRCLWCHNPETYIKIPQLEFNASLCRSCGLCVDICSKKAQHLLPRLVDRSLCSSCGDCVDICPAQALKIIGEKKTIGQVIQELWKDKDFYFASNGGITCSGGEPMLQIEFLRDLLMEAKSHNLHTAVDTAGAVAYENYAQILKYTDLFLYDIKLFDRQKHKKATGGDNQLILQNIQKLSADGARIIVRTPLIKGINDDLAEIDKIAAFLEPLQIELIQLLAYHSYGLGKYQNLDIKDTSADFQAPDEDFLNQALEIYHQHGLNAEIG